MQGKNIPQNNIWGPQKVLLVNFLGRGSTNRQIEVLLEAKRNQKVRC